MFLFNKYFIPKWLFVTAVILIVGLVALIYFSINRTNQNQPTLTQSPAYTATNTDFVSGLSKVQPANTISFEEYKILDLSDGRQLLSIPKALLTREPFASAVNRYKSNQTIFRPRSLFFYNPANKEVTFLGSNLANLVVLKVKNVDYWVFSSYNTDCTQGVFYSLPNFLKQRRVKDFKDFSIISFSLAGSILEVTVNKAQRGEVLEKYSIDFTNFEFNTNTTTAEFTDKGPTVKIIQ